MTWSTSEVAVCCSSDSVSSRVRCCSASNSRAFSIAIENVRLFDEIQDKNRQLQQASENKSQFVSSMSHELRTPLNAIIGLTEMMVKNAARFGTEKAQEPLQRVNRAGTHLLGLIGDGEVFKACAAAQKAVLWNVQREAS